MDGNAIILAGRLPASDQPPPVNLPVIAFRPAEPLTPIGKLLRLADLGSDYLAERITDEQYVTAAVSSDLLPRREAIDRCLAIDTLRAWW